MLLLLSPGLLLWWLQVLCYSFCYSHPTTDPMLMLLLLLPPFP